MIWARLECEQPCVARRFVEQQRQQHAVLQSQQQHADECQQQYRLSLCEGDSERGGTGVPAFLTGQSAPIHGSPQRPDRKPTSRRPFPDGLGRETKTEKSRGLVAGRKRLVKIPGLILQQAQKEFIVGLYRAALVIFLLLGSLSAKADGVVQGDSPSFTLDTTGISPGIGGIGFADSADFTLNTTFVTLTVTVIGGGSVARSPDQTNYFIHSTVTLTPQPSLGFAFTGWSGSVTGASNPLNLVLTSNRTVTANFASTVADTIVDNTNATFTGTWTTDTGSGGSGFFAVNFRHATTVASATGTGTFRPTLPVTGNYNVYVWFPTISPPSQRCSDAQYFISGSTSNNTVSVDQSGGGGGNWRLIATTRKFDAGTNGFVRLSNQSTDTGRRVAADAVRWVWSTSQQSQTVAPLYITGITRSNTTATVTWQSISNRSYRLEYKTNLTDAIWQNVSGDVTATSTAASKTDNTLGNTTRRYYRVGLLP